MFSKIFYLTSNEMLQRDLGPKYFIYLVESSKMTILIINLSLSKTRPKDFKDKKIENDFTFYDEENGFSNLKGLYG